MSASAPVADLHNWIEALATPYEKTGRAALSEAQKTKTLEKINAVIQDFNQREAAASRPSTSNPVRIIYREPDPDPEIQQLKQQVNILKAQVEARKAKAVHSIRSTQDFTMLFAVLLPLARTPERVEHLMSMMHLHRCYPSLSWEQLVERSYANRPDSDPTAPPGPSPARQ